MDKKWWQSKIFYASVGETLTGVSALIIDGIDSGIGWAAIAIGVATFIFRVWFTDKAIG